MRGFAVDPRQGVNVLPFCVLALECRPPIAFPHSDVKVRLSRNDPSAQPIARTCPLLRQIPILIHHTLPTYLRVMQLKRLELSPIPHRLENEEVDPNEETRNATGTTAVNTRRPWYSLRKMEPAELLRVWWGILPERPPGPAERPEQQQSILPMQLG